MLSRRKFLAACACCAVSASGWAAAQEAPQLSIEELAAGVWRHTSWKLLQNGAPFPSSGVIVRGAHTLLLIDTTWPTVDMPRLLDWCLDAAEGRTLRIAVTHAHDDRMSGLAIARGRGVRSLAHALSQADAPARGLPIADETWRGRTKRLDLGGRRVELYFPGPAHTRDNVVAFVPEVGVLFGGCQVRAAGAAALGNVADARLAQWPAATRRLISRYGARVATVVPGHGDPGGPELLEHTLALAEQAVAQGR